jgi:hypothetical protein
MSDQYLSIDELNEVIEICAGLANLPVSLLSLGPIPVSDSNGEVLGFVSRSHNDETYAFYLQNPDEA